MLPAFLFACAVICTALHLFIKKQKGNSLEIALSYLLFFNVGCMGVLAFYAHVFMADEIAKEIGWTPGSPFQFEMGMANLAFGILGLLSVWLRGSFWIATIIGYAILLLGAFVGHMIQYSLGDTAPYNSGILVWFGDLFIPLLLLILLKCTLYQQPTTTPH